MSKPKVAIVHDYLIDYGGAEKVLHELHNLYPKAPVYVSLVDKKGMGKFWKLFEDAEIKKSWFGYLPFSAKLISPLRFMLPLVWGSFNFTDYDVVISSASWAVTKGFKRGEKTIEICYCHTPPRYLYGYDTSRRWDNKWYEKIVDAYALIVNHFMRMYDFKQAQKVDYFVVNSENTGKRVKKFYRKDYKVIYPPVDVKERMDSEVKPSKGPYYLAGGRLVAAKNFDIIIKACKKAKVNLKIFGTGVDEDRLKRLASDGVEFLGRVTDKEQISYFKGAKAFILAQADEDFGITPVEAAASGCPSIAYRGGGYLETVVDGKTGVFFDKLTAISLAKAINNFEKTKIEPRDCINHAKRFSNERFKKEMLKHIETHAKK